MKATKGPKGQPKSKTTFLVPPGGALLQETRPGGKAKPVGVLNAETMTNLRALADKWGTTPQEALIRAMEEEVPPAKRKGPPLLEVKFRRDTLASMGFMCLTHGETMLNCTLRELRSIGKKLHERGLVEDAADWYVLTPKLGFTCNGREFEMDVRTFHPATRSYTVVCIQHQTAAEKRDELVPMMVPRWIHHRLIETACAADIKGGPIRLLEVELGGLLSESAHTFH